MLEVGCVDICNYSQKSLGKANMYDLCHPSYYFISKLGCDDHVKIATAFYVYIELCEVKRLWNVHYKYNKELDIIYLEGSKRKLSSPEIYIPWSTTNNITLAQIEKIQTELNELRVTFVFKSEDSTSVYYRVTSGLAKPLSPEITKQLKEKEDKKITLEKEIRKNTSHLYELAKTLSTESLDSDCQVLSEKDHKDPKPSTSKDNAVMI